MPLDSDAANDFMTALRRMRLLQPDERPTLVALQGGVSSDIVRADLRTGPVCIKRALHKLKVKADWQAPVERNRWEVEWMRVVAGIEPDAVPRILGADESLGMFAMAFLSPQTYPLWKARLRDGTIEPPFAAEVGARLARIHAATANNAQLRSRFATDHIFLPIR
ncbi:MAG TPA: aminoglycoside phosphotransferase family protein, partial [Burkholderiales bacterium]|nr:aminoglycoside phosphotransferase family protein [Burkholderiales bacterium]